MPKKFHGENTKAAEARARQAARTEAEVERKKQAEEDEYWKDDDKNTARKAQRKEDKLKKQQDAINRKLETRALLEKEQEKIGGKATTSSPKITQAEIFVHQEKMQQERLKQEEKEKLEAKKIVVAEDLLTENVNRLEIEGEQARTVDEAINLLTDKTDAADRHPEKRSKAAYASYEEKFMPILKEENPNLRLSQLRQMLKKQWQKAPENPLNQRIES